MSRPLEVGDKVQTTFGWASEYKHAIVTKAKDGRVWVDWYWNNGEVHTGLSYSADTLYLLEPHKKGLCKFLDKVQQEYSK